MTCKVHQ